MPYIVVVGEFDEKKDLIDIPRQVMSSLAVKQKMGSDGEVVVCLTLYRM